MAAAPAHFRAHGRRPTQLEAEVTLPPPLGKRPGRVLNLSLAGACLELDGAPAVGRSVELALWLPSLWAPLPLSAEVCWRHVGQPERAGVRFTTGPDKTLERLLQYLESESSG